MILPINHQLLTIQSGQPISKNHFSSHRTLWTNVLEFLANINSQMFLLKRWHRRLHAARLCRRASTRSRVSSHCFQRSSPCLWSIHSGKKYPGLRLETKLVFGSCKKTQNESSSFSMIRQRKPRIYVTLPTKDK